MSVQSRVGNSGLRISFMLTIPKIMLYLVPVMYLHGLKKLHLNSRSLYGASTVEIIIFLTWGNI